MKVCAYRSSSSAPALDSCAQHLRRRCVLLPSSRLGAVAICTPVCGLRLPVCSSRGAALRTRVIAPNDVDVDSAGSSHEEQPLEKELAAQVALRAALLSAADSPTATALQLPAYTKMQLHMPGISVTTGIGLHVEGIDPQEAAAAAAAAQSPPSLDQLRASLATTLSEEVASTSISNGSVHPEVAEMSSATSASASVHSQQRSPSSSMDVVDRIAHLTATPEPASIASRGLTSQSTLQPASSSAPSPSKSAVEIPKPILIISFISASLTMASCVFNTLLPIYMVAELKMTMRSMGVFEGMLEAFSYMIRMFSGVASDMMTSRKGAITLGFAMGAMAKFGMSGATEVGTIFTSKAMDRLANGVQAAPRDALISDLAPDGSRSACFGFAQSMRKWGSAVGAVMVYFLMKASGNNYQMIFTMAATVSLASCAAFVLLVPSHARPQRPNTVPDTAAQASSSNGTDASKQQAVAAPARAAGFQLSQFIKDVTGMGGDFYRMLSIIFLLGMGHINESLLEARAIEVGFGKAESTLVVAALSFVIFVVAYPLGRLDDKYGPRMTFGVSMISLILADLVLMTSGTHPWAVFASLVFMGIHMGVMQGPLLSIVVGLAPGHLRGTAFGIFYTVMAVTALAANSMFGTVWYSCGAPAAFALSAGVTTLTLLALPWLLPNRPLRPAVATA